MNAHSIYFNFIGYPQGHFEQTTSVATATAPMTGQPVIPIPPNGQPASYAPPPFLVPPPQFISPQTAPPSIINYVPGPNGPAFQPNFQGYQGYSSPVQVHFSTTKSFILFFKLHYLKIITYIFYLIFYSHNVLHLHKNCFNRKVVLTIVQRSSNSNNNNQLQ